MPCARAPGAANSPDAAAAEIKQERPGQRDPSATGISTTHLGPHDIEALRIEFRLAKEPIDDRRRERKELVAEALYGEHDMPVFNRDTEHEPGESRIVDFLLNLVSVEARKKFGGDGSQW